MRKKVFINLKKGSKLLIRPSNIEIWSHRPDILNANKKIIDDIEFSGDIIFVNSLKGSSKAIPFQF